MVVICAEKRRKGGVERKGGNEERKERKVVGCSNSGLSSTVSLKSRGSPPKVHSFRLRTEPISSVSHDKLIKAPRPTKIERSSSRVAVHISVQPSHPAPLHTHAASPVACRAIATASHPRARKNALITRICHVGAIFPFMDGFALPPSVMTAASLNHTAYSRN